MAADDMMSPVGTDTRSLRDYLALLWHRKFLILVPCICGLSLTVVVVLALPAVYSSSAVILVESQQFPDEFVDPRSSRVGERVQTLQQRLTTRENLLRLARDNGVFAVPEPMPADIVESMTQAITFEEVNSTARSREEQVTIAVTITFNHREPQVARAVVDDLAAQFLNENSRSRNERVNVTSDFISRESQRLTERVELIESEIADYRTQYSEVLPERSALYAERLEDLKDTLRELESEKRLLETRQNTLLGNLAALTKSKTGNDTVANQLLSTRTELLEARNKFTDAHPEVIRLERQVASLGAELARAEAERTDQDGLRSELGADPRYVQLQYQQASVQREIDELNAQIDTVNNDIARINDRLEQIPIVAQDIAALQRKYDDAVTQLREMNTKELQAELTERLEQQRMSERFTLIEPPTLPERPVQPNRKLLFVIGAALTLVLSIGVLAIVELIDNGIRRKQDLKPYFPKGTPIISVPYVPGFRDRLWRSLRFATVAVVVVACLTAAGFSLQAHYITPVANELALQAPEPQVPQD